MSHANNLTDVSLSAGVQREVFLGYESGRRVRIPKRGSFFELPPGDPRLIPISGQWVLSIDDVAVRLKPADVPGRGMMLLLVFLLAVSDVLFGYSGVIEWKNHGFGFVPIFFLSMSAVVLIFSILLIHWIIKEPVDYPVLLNRRTRKIIQMRGREKVEADWSELRPFVERAYSASAAVFWKLHVIKPTPAGAAEKHIILKILGEGPDGCLRRYEFLRRYMEGRWEDLPRTRLVEMRRPLLKQFSHDFIWMFGKRPWQERPGWLKGLMYVLLPVVVLISWPFQFFLLFGSRFGWIPTFPPDVEAEASGGVLPPALAERVIHDPPLAATEKWFYGSLIVIATVFWGVMASWGMAFLFGSLD